MEDAVENMALFRRFVLNIVKQSNCGARSQRNKLKEPQPTTTFAKISRVPRPGRMPGHQPVLGWLVLFSDQSDAQTGPEFLP